MISERIDAASAGAVKLAKQVLDPGGAAILQFAAPPYPAKVLSSINGLCREFGDRLEIRFYAHYGLEFDFGVLDAVPDVANLSTDCLQKAIKC